MSASGAQNQLKKPKYHSSAQCGFCEHLSDIDLLLCDCVCWVHPSPILSLWHICLRRVQFGVQFRLTVPEAAKSTLRIVWFFFCFGDTSKNDQLTRCLNSSLSAAAQRKYTHTLYIDSSVIIFTKVYFRCFVRRPTTEPTGSQIRR